MIVYLQGSGEFPQNISCHMAKELLMAEILHQLIGDR